MTRIVCAKCGKTEAYYRAKQMGWLVALRKNSSWQLVIRCPRHITAYARKLAGK